MKKVMENVVQFPVDAQSSGFFCAFVSLILAAQEVNEKTPVYCGRNQSICLNCGSCGKKPMMARHHLACYHEYITMSGLGLLWKDDDEKGLYEELYKKNVFIDNLPDRLNISMKIAGYGYTMLKKDIGKDAIFKCIEESISNEMPVLMKLGNGRDWHVVTGCDTYGQTLYGIDSHKHWDVKSDIKPDGYLENGLFYTQNWFDDFACVVIIDGETEKLGFSDIIERMITSLDRDENKDLELKIIESLGDSGKDRKELAKWLNSLSGYSVECRWHGAECFTARMYHMTENNRIKELLCEATSQYLLFHDLCWKIWGLLGVGPETNYNIADDVSLRLEQEETREEMKKLFQKLFEIDKNVLGMLKEISGLI